MASWEQTQAAWGQSQTVRLLMRGWGKEWLLPFEQLLLCRGNHRMLRG